MRHSTVQPQGSLKQRQAGRIRPFLIAIVILGIGLLLDKWWWQIGLIIIVVFLVENYFHYRYRG
jgi:hypothetical protein